MKLNLLCWLSNSEVQEEHKDLLHSVPMCSWSGKFHSGWWCHVCCCTVFLNVACCSFNTQLESWILFVLSVMQKSVL